MLNQLFSDSIDVNKVAGVDKEARNQSMLARKLDEDSHTGKGQLAKYPEIRVLA